jgi:DNA-binding NarL/FixJ family response regulator
VGKPTRLVIADDHPVVREGLRTLIAEEQSIEVVGEARTGDEAVQVARSAKPDVVLMDLVMPGTEAALSIRNIRAASPATQVLVLTSFSDPANIETALAAGAIGYLLKDIGGAELVRAIHAAALGQPTLHPEAQRHLMDRMRGPAEDPALASLTAREREVLELVAAGRNNRAIATRLGISEGTVKGYVSAVLEKLGVDDRTQAALYAIKHGLVRNDGGSRP